MLEVGKKRDEKMNKQAYFTHREEREALLVDATQLVHRTTALEYPTKKHQLERRIAKLDAQISRYVSGQTTRSWDRQTRSLYKRSDQHVGILVISNRIMGRPTESFFMDPDKCPHCIQLYRFDHITNVHTCPKCGYTVDVLFITEDTSQDCLVTRDPNTGSGTPSKWWPITITYAARCTDDT
jgi:ssDNA-binding Zn-finger/Zn-ribbon topoisomerase 1